MKILYFLDWWTLSGRNKWDDCEVRPKLKKFRFHIDGIDAPLEFIKTFKAKSRVKAWEKAVAKYGSFVHYYPIPKRKRK